MSFTRHERLVIYIFKRCRSVPKTLSELAEITGEPYKSPSYVRKVVQKYRTALERGEEGGTDDQGVV